VTRISREAFYRCYNLISVTFENTSGWYVGNNSGEETTVLRGSDLSNPSTAATYLINTYKEKYWLK